MTWVARIARRGSLAVDRFVGKVVAVIAEFRSMLEPRKVACWRSPHGRAASTPNHSESVNGCLAWPPERCRESWRRSLFLEGIALFEGARWPLGLWTSAADRNWPSGAPRNQSFASP